MRRRIADRHGSADIHRSSMAGRWASGWMRASSWKMMSRERMPATIFSPPTWRWIPSRGTSSRTGSEAMATSTWCRPVDASRRDLAGPHGACDLRLLHASLHDWWNMRRVPFCGGRSSGLRRWATSRWPAPSWSITSSTTLIARLRRQDTTDLEAAGLVSGGLSRAQGTREEKLNGAVRRHLTQSGIPVECSKGEWGKGQHELNVR